jgi:GDP-L-fucose synthase
MTSNNETVLITGGSGFLGRAVGRKVTGATLLAPKRAELDLLRMEDVDRYLSNKGVKRIIHAAGYVGGIGLHTEHPGRMIAENLRMGLNLLESAARNGVEHVVIISTVCVYPENAAVPTPETEIFNGMPADDTAGYGIAKRTLLTLAEGLHKEFGLQYTYVIPTNMYGPGDYFEENRSHVVSALLRRAMVARDAGDREMVVWGDGRSTRDFIFVDDAAAAIAACLTSKAYGQSFNVGSGREVSIQELAETICDVVGFKGELRWDTDKPNGARRRALDSTRLKQVLGVEMKTGLREGLQATVKWMEENRVVAAR